MLELVKNDGNFVLKPQVASLEAVNAAEFKEALDEIDWSDCKTVSVNCSKISFIDSSGIGALLHLHHRLGTEVRPLRLINVTPPVMSVIELLRLNTVFSLDSSM